MSDCLIIPAPAPRPDDVKVVTFGCRLNACESEVIRARAAAESVSDTIVFNTCAVTAEAVRQARQAIRKARRERPNSRLVATGCAVQIDPDAVAAMGEIDVVLGNAAKTRPGALAASGERVRVEGIMSARSAWNHGGAVSASGRSYVAIQNGCDHRCTFCVIPLGRGNARSAPAETVVARIKGSVAAGAKEVVLTGVDLTSWGGDLAGAPSLGDLVVEILARTPELCRLRLSSIDAAEVDPVLLACFASESRLMPHVHLSLQAGDDIILKRMKRRHSRAQALDLIASVREARPDVALGADLIAGFPTETEAAFQRTLDFVEEASLAFLHVFPYSPRPMTPAARMPQLAPATIKARAARLRQAGEAAHVRHLDRKLGVTTRALVEGDGAARAEDFTRVVFDGEVRPGTLIRGKLSSHDGQRAKMAPWAITA
jgi:threonylcarbamoyladenosine tRNA methylthiotransferase MtaB